MIIIFAVDHSQAEPAKLYHPSAKQIVHVHDVTQDDGSAIHDYLQVIMQHTSRHTLCMPCEDAT